jgi:hypothetical protein
MFEPIEGVIHICNSDGWTTGLGGAYSKPLEYEIQERL